MLLKILSDNDQIDNIETDAYGNIQGNASLKKFSLETDDYTRFEIRKYINFTDLEE